MPNFENAFNTVCELVKDFKENEHRYLSPQYQEAEVRRDFIDKLFEALGWDVYHRTQKNPYEQEVKVEKGVSIGKAQKRADYAFYIRPEYRQPKFFAEAKKPSRSLKNADDYFQTIRYGWNSNTPIAVLTDFEEFHVLDCRFKPNLNTVLDNPNHKSYRYADYTNKEIFKEIYYLFSRDDVEKNSLEKYSEAFAKIKGKGKTTFKSIIKTIDDDFLEYIDEVRETLAKAFKKNDAKLSSEELTEATQRTIDRIVFIRFLEDKLIEPEYYISEFGKKGNAWNEFISVCRKLDAKYNGIVFKKHFIDEQNFQGPEQNTFKKICDEMSYLNSPYDFNAIPIHILGSIYERFLGKVVNATAQRVKVEEKPEVRKAGGVYYTPKYIVDYIVDNTVGKILTNQESNASIPACEDQKIPLLGGVDIEGGRGGSENKGNASIPACDEDPKIPLGRRSAVAEGVPAWRGGSEGKTPAEISKLRFADIACGSGSFLIGVFETLLKYHTEYYQLHPEQAKKDGCINKDGLWILSIKQKQNILVNNIFGVDIDNQAVEVTQLSLALKMLEDETGGTANDMQNMFHEKILPDLSKNIICGNSLIGTDILQGKMFATDEERKLNPMDFENRFSEVMRNGGFDAIVGNPPYLSTKGINNIEKIYFIDHYETAVGQFDLYVLFMEKVLNLLKHKGLLGYITSNTFLNNKDFCEFRKLIVSKKNIQEIVNFGETVFKDASLDVSILLIQNYYLDNNKIKIFINAPNFFNEKYHYLEQSIFNKEENNYELQIRMEEQDLRLLNKLFSSNSKFSDYFNFPRGIEFGSNSDKILNTFKDGYDKLLVGKNISKYIINFDNKYVKYENDKSVFKDKIVYTSNKILIQRIRNLTLEKRIIATLDKEKYLCTNTLRIALPKDEMLNMQFFLGILNSNLINYIFSKMFFNKDIYAYQLERIPLPFNTYDKNSIISHDKIVSLVNEMLEAKKQLQTIKTDRDKTYYENKCADLDHAIDSEVYKLYGLTEEEIKIVEGKG